MLLAALWYTGLQKSGFDQITEIKYNINWLCIAQILDSSAFLSSAITH
jgi:hypothetical protein